MFSSKKTTAPVASAASDPYFDYVTLLLPANGTNGAQNNTFLDSSSNAFTITRNGSATQGTFSPYGSLWSNYFNASSYLTLGTAWTPGSGDFSIEAWANFSTIAGDTNYRTIMSNYGSGVSVEYIFGLYNIGTPHVLFYTSVSGNIQGATTLIAGVWYHIAVTRVSGTIRIFVNGVLDAYVTGDTSAFSSATTEIGKIPNASQSGYMYGYISNLRCLSGGIPSAYSTSSSTIGATIFTPPTTPLTAITNTFLLTCQSNSFVDNSASPNTFSISGSPSVQRFNPFLPSSAYSASVIGGSGYFNGSTDYLTTPSISVGTNAFCFECWFYPLSTTQIANSPFIGNNSSYDLQIGYYSSTGIGIALSGVQWDLYETTYLPIPYAWNHIAFVRTSTGTNQTSIFLNGVRVANGTVTSNYSSSVLQIAGFNSVAYLNGYLSDCRLVNGSSPYSASSTTITVPTAPLTAITNTALLLNYTNAGIIDNAMMNDLVTVGSAQISTSVVKYGTGSMKFNGSTDYLYPSASNPIYAFGTGNFTIEGWFYFSNVTSEAELIDFRPASTQGAYPMIYVQSGNLYYWVSSTNQITGTSAVTTSTWYHIAVCRSGTSTKMFVNGTQVGSTYTDSTNYLVGSNRPFLGLNASSSIQYFNGYMDDVRITNGYARYTSNFTPPTAQLPLY